MWPFDSPPAPEMRMSPDLHVARHHRTGSLRRFGAEHPYGAQCYAEAAALTSSEAWPDGPMPASSTPTSRPAFRACAVRGLAALLGIRTRYLQREPDR